MQKGLYSFIGEGRELGGGCHPASEVCFERRLVIVAGYFGLAGDLHHDLATAVLLRKESIHAFQHALDAGLPGGVPVCLKMNISFDHWTRLTQDSLLRRLT